MPTIKELLERSKISFESDTQKLGCVNHRDPLVEIHSTGRLILEPIWQKPLDEREGPLYEQYLKDHPGSDVIMLREGVATRLYTAAENLPQHLKLVLREGYRPLALQHELLQALIDTYRVDNVDATPEQAHAYANTYVANPDLILPPHCCGAAVDVDVLDTKTNQLMDFGSPVNVPLEISFLHSDEVSPEQHANRMVLLEAMVRAGFAPCYVEWWHYSYGDTVWAYFYKKSGPLYSIVKPNLG